MSVYRYTGFRSDGKETKGRIDATSLKEAIQKLKEGGIYPRQIREETLSRSIKNLSLPHITRQLSTLIASGVTVTESLKCIAEEGDKKTRKILTDIRERVSEGASLSKALESHTEIFPDFYINMVRAGEASGELPAILERIAKYLEEQESIKAKLTTAMIYPSIMLLTGTGVLIFVFVYVMPRITKIFSDTGADLPLITTILMTITDIITKIWFLIPLTIILILYILRYLKKRYPLHVDRLLLNEPTGILRSLYLARLTKTLAFLLEGGVPLVKALELSSRVTGNIVIQSIVKDASISVSEGGRLSSIFRDISTVLGELISTGEKSGRLVENLRMASRTYEEEFSRKVTKGLTIFEPMMILLMGTVILFVVLGVVLPVFEINRLIRP